MGVKKVNLLRADDYAALIAVQKMADLIVSSVRGEPGPIEIRVEDARFKLWDDLTVLYRHADGTERLEAWQVKRQTGKLRRQQMVDLLAALHEQTAIHLARFAVRSMVDVTGVAPLAALEALCDSASAPSIDLTVFPATKVTDHQTWWDLASEVAGGEPSPTLDLLSRLRVEARGTDGVVREHIADKLRAITDRPEELRDRLRAWGKDCLDPAGVITWDVLAPQVQEFLGVEDHQRAAQSTAVHYESEVAQSIHAHRDVHIHQYGTSPPPAAPPSPTYRDSATRALADELDGLYEERAIAEESGTDTTDLTQRILVARRSLRHGPQLCPGDFLGEGRFRLLECIGKGGFAMVWRAYDKRDRSVVAVKVLHGQHAEDRSRIERFLRGAKRMAALDHPAIVRVIEAEGEEDGYRFFVMEHLGGGDLQVAVRVGKVGGEGGLDIVLQIGDALASAHAAGLVHRDVKPANILLTADGRPKLSDFDLVRAADTTGGTRTGALGAFLFAAPEALYDAGRVDERSDVYSLGVTALFVLHGGDLPPIAARGPERVLDSLPCRPAVKDAIGKALEFERDARWPTASAFCRALAQALHWVDTGSGSLALPEQPPEQPPSSRPPPPPEAREEALRLLSGLWRDIPSGSFLLGSPDDEHGRDSDEGPQVEVRFERGFRMLAVPITNLVYELFDPSHRAYRAFEDEADDVSEHPVVNVSWGEAAAFAEWLGGWLPSEAEWEYACRAGTTTRYWPGDDEGDLARVAWYGANSGGRPHPVGEKLANDWGLHDVHGNVWEWTSSPWTPNHRGRVPGAIEPPPGPGRHDLPTGGFRVIRGGSWVNSALSARSAFRSWWLPAGRNRSQGFRPVLPAPSED